MGVSVSHFNKRTRGAPRTSARVEALAQMLMKKERVIKEANGLPLLIKATPRHPYPVAYKVMCQVAEKDDRGWATEAKG